jgi:hypothetical protein
VYGARKAVISHNTVVHSEGLTGPYPYIAVRNHKNGSPNSDVLVANNVAMSFTGSTNMGTAVEFRNNSVVGTPGAVFENPFALDYRPRATSGFIDTADPASASAVDILGKSRPSGKGPDRGAYEIIQSVVPAPSPPPDNATPPKTEGPAIAGPIVNPPATSPPVMIAPVVTPPAVAKPPATKPIEAKGPPKSMGRLVVRSFGGLMRNVMGRLLGFSL